MDPKDAAMPMYAVVIPCYRVKQTIADVLARIGPEIDHIYCVDDGCPDGSGEHIENKVHDARVRVLYHECNQGVGGATITGYRAALADGATIIVKLDGDGQMDPGLISLFMAPIENQIADYSKGNRFFSLDHLRGMPIIRIIGNSVLSFFTKLSSGYWHIFDPTNGFTAIHTNVLRKIPLDKISRDYYFESDMLFRLNILRAAVVDVPVVSVYSNESSNLKIPQIFIPFVVKNLRNTWKRIMYNYFIRDLNAGSLSLVLGTITLAFGTIFGASEWLDSIETGKAATSGTVMLSGLPVIVGVQFLMAFLNYDIANVPSRPIHWGLSDQ